MQWSDGMLYPLLHRMERMGWASTTWRTSDGGRRRKHYAITDSGRALLAERRLQWKVVADALNQVWPSAALPADPRTGVVVMDADAELEAQIGHWRGYVQRHGVISTSSVDEMEDHLREQVCSCWRPA